MSRGALSRWEVNCRKWAKQDANLKAGVACDECAGSGMTTYAARGLYQTTCRKCWGTGQREQMVAVDPAPFGKLNVPNPDFLHEELASYEASLKPKE
jgi:hypothetical protein